MKSPVELLRGGPQTISPTAHYTGYVWASNGLGPRELTTLEGRVMHTGLLPLAWASALVGGPSLDNALLARHRTIDALLTESIEAGRVTQVVEVAAGMSPRGYRFMETYDGRITYIEADLPDMIERKRSTLERLPLSSGHRFVEIDALRPGGPDSLESILGGLDHSEGIAVITEGLVNYLPTEVLRGLWQRLAALLAGFEHGVYLSDIVPKGVVPGPLERVATAALGVFVRSGTFLHFAGDEETARALTDAGFTAATIHDPGEPAVRVIEAFA